MKSPYSQISAFNLSEKFFWFKFLSLYPLYILQPKKTQGLVPWAGKILIFRTGNKDFFARFIFLLEIWQKHFSFQKYFHQHLE